LRGEQDPLPTAGEEEGFDSEVVAGEHETGRTVTPVQQRQAPHPVEAGEAVGPPFFVGVEHYLRVAIRAKGVADGLELGPQLAKVGDLAVVDDVHKPVI